MYDTYIYNIYVCGCVDNLFYFCVHVCVQVCTHALTLRVWVHMLMWRSEINLG